MAARRQSGLIAWVLGGIADPQVIEHDRPRGAGSDQRDRVGLAVAQRRAGVAG